jgi:hypothetical protein
LDTDFLPSKAALALAGLQERDVGAVPIDPEVDHHGDDHIDNIVSSFDFREDLPGAGELGACVVKFLPA